MEKSAHRSTVNSWNMHGKDYELKSLACNYCIIQELWIMISSILYEWKIAHFPWIQFFFSRLNIYRFSQVKVDEDELNDFNIPAQPNVFTYTFFSLWCDVLFFFLLSRRTCYLEEVSGFVIFFFVCIEVSECFMQHRFNLNAFRFLNWSS